MKSEWILTAEGIADVISGATMLAAEENNTSSDILRLAIASPCEHMNDDEHMTYTIIGAVLDRIDPEARRLLLAQAIHELSQLNFKPPAQTPPPNNRLPTRQGYSTSLPATVPEPVPSPPTSRHSRARPL